MPTTRGPFESILRFLGVDESVALAAVEANPTVQVRSQLLNEAVHAIGDRTRATFTCNQGGDQECPPDSLRRDAFHAVRERVVFSEPRTPDLQLTAELRKRLKPEVVAFGEYLQRDLVTLWGYDSVD